MGRTRVVVVVSMNDMACPCVRTIHADVPRTSSSMLLKRRMAGVLVISVYP